MAIHNSFSQSQTNRQYIFLYKIWEITLGKLVWRDIFCSHFSRSHQKQKLLYMRYFGKVHIEAPLLAGWLTWCNAKRNWGNLPQMEGRRPQVQLHCGEPPHYHTADHSKLAQRAFYAPGPCICDLYLLSADHLVQFPQQRNGSSESQVGSLWWKLLLKELVSSFPR